MLKNKIEDFIADFSDDNKVYEEYINENYDDIMQDVEDTLTAKQLNEQ